LHSNREKALVAGGQKTVEVKGNTWKSLEFIFAPMTRFEVESVPLEFQIQQKLTDFDSIITRQLLII